MIISTYQKLSKQVLPPFSNTRIMMQPVILGTLAGVPKHYDEVCMNMYREMDPKHRGKVGYLTIDEQRLQPGQTLRKAGLHVDGYYHGKCGAWGGGGSWGSVGNGMLTLSSTPHCKAYKGEFDGDPGAEGECDHIDVGQGEVFAQEHIYWVDGACIHESLPVLQPTERQFVRLSLPSNGPWFEGYTPSPAGILPSGPILPDRPQMKEMTK